MEEKILKISFRMFLEKGFAGVSLNEVIKEVGLTKGGFYYYFKSKEELLLKVIDHFLFSFLDKRLTILKETPGSAEEKIKRFFHGILNFEKILREGLNGVSVDFRSFYLLLMEGVKRFKPLNRQHKIFHENMRETIRDILEEGKRQGDVSGDIDSLEMAYHIVACGEGLLLQWVANPHMDVERIINKSCVLVVQNFARERR